MYMYDCAWLQPHFFMNHECDPATPSHPPFTATPSCRTPSAVLSASCAAVPTIFAPSPKTQVGEHLTGRGYGGHYDLILSSETIYSVPAQERLLECIKRVSGAGDGGHSGGWVGWGQRRAGWGEGSGGRGGVGAAEGGVGWGQRRAGWGGVNGGWGGVGAAEGGVGWGQRRVRWGGGSGGGL